MIIQGDSNHIPLPTESVHLIVSSPPYWNAREYSSWERYDDYLLEMFYILRENYRVLVNGGRLCWNVPQGYDRDPYIPLGCDIQRLVTDAGFTLRGIIVWDKGGINSTAWGSWASASNPSLRDAHEIIIVAHKGSAARESGGVSDLTAAEFPELTQSVWRGIIPLSNHWHPAPFPVDLPRRLIKLYSYVGDVVLDPFAGSGKTIQAARMLGRLGIGVELSCQYARHASLALAHDEIAAAQIMLGQASFLDTLEGS